MKKILFSLAALLFFSCGSNEEPIIPTDPVLPENPKEYIVSLGFSGEITNIEESPLSRAVSNDLYGVQVYSMPANGAEYKPYAYGLFDDKANMSVKLLEGYKYKFASTMVVNGKNVISSDGQNGYRYPFIAKSAAYGTSIGTSFLYSSDNAFSALSWGYASLVGKDSSGRPNTDRYYGESPAYIPTENGIISINMKRVVFGAKITTEGLTEGKISISIKDAPIMFITYPATTVEDIYTFENTNNYSTPMAWTMDDYTETVALSASWEKADGAVIPLVTQDIVFKRNKLTTITLKVKDNSINSGVDISNENIPMGDGGSITIDTSNGTNTGVTPNP